MSDDPRTRKYWEEVAKAVATQLSDMEECETGITMGGAAVEIRIDKEGEYISFCAEEHAKDWLTDPRMTADGRTVGQMNQDLLRERLDQWIEQACQ